MKIRTDGDECIGKGARTILLQLAESDMMRQIVEALPLCETVVRTPSAKIENDSAPPREPKPLSPYQQFMQQCMKSKHGSGRLSECAVEWKKAK